MGTGQFRPGDAVNPHIGTVGQLGQTQEVRVETLCMSEEVARKAVNALIRQFLQPYLGWFINQTEYFIRLH